MLVTTSKDNDTKEGEGRAAVKVVDRPTFILKTREGESRAVSPSQRNGNKKEQESATNLSIKSQDPPKTTITMSTEMTNYVKFMDENMQLCEQPLEYLCDQQDFLVVGILGPQGVGKSTIMSFLTSEYISNLFPAQELSHHESGSNCTSGIDFYVSKNRVIYLDTQPILSASLIDHSSTFDQKKQSTDFTNAESNLELQSLQFAAFLFSVCHVIIFVQDWFVDPDILRFLQTAEMLKPASTSTMDQDYVEYNPHILFLHNKAELHDFTPNNIEKMKGFYSKIFSASRLRTHSSLDMCDSVSDGGLNFFLVPKITKEDDPAIHEDKEKLIRKLRMKIHSMTCHPMTPSTLTERNWYHYVSKVMEAIKKSHLSSEYGRLMP
ncbi:nonsense-mediated mRNA decay factor SMG9-like [Prorops nasuta]|uniref:nonsense-mediated mRNA decay factor SMG9-like n=1 Tax=Prorops nasuta TaxID=863751 RepID=UPI0034CD6BD7